MGLFNLFKKEKKQSEDSYYGLLINSNNQLQYLGHYDNMELSGNDMPEYISSLLQQVPNVHYLIVPQYGLLILIKSDKEFMAQKFQSPMSKEKASEYIASMMKAGKRVKTIEKFGAFEFNY